MDQTSMRPYPPLCQMFFQFLLVKSQLFCKVNLVWFDLPFVFALRSQIWFKAHVFWLHLAPFCRPDCLLVTIPYCFDRNPMRFPVRSSSVPLFSEVLRSFVVFFCGATILFSGSHNPLPCFYPLVLGVCYCLWFRQCRVFTMVSRSISWTGRN